MDASTVNSSGSKIAQRSDFRVAATREALIKPTKQKQKNIQKIGTWNVTTLLQPGKLENLKMEMKRQNMSILGISEMRWQGTGDFWSDEYRIIYSGTEGGRTGQRGVAIVLNKPMGMRVTGYVQHSDRILLVKIKSSPADTVIIQVYMPTSNAEDEEIERMYEEINDLIDKTRAEDNVIIMGDMNATVGEGRDGIAVGEFGLGVRNERGDMLVEFCTRNNLIITNTQFNHHKRRRYTWKAPGDVRRAQIDYIMVKNRFKNQIKNCRSYPAADIGSDHNLVMMHAELKYKKLEKKKVKKYDFSKLKNERVKEEYERRTNSMAERNITEDMTIENEWNNIKEGILKTADNLLKSEPNTKRKPWISEEVINLINERRNFKNRNDDESKQRYRALRNEIVRKSRRDKETYLNDICEEIDLHLNTNNLDKGYGLVKKFFGDKKNKTSGIKDENGQYLYEEKEIARRWRKYIEQLYGDEEMCETAIEREEEVSRENKGESILYEEFEKALKEMKSRKAPGIDEIPAELLTNCGEEAKKNLYKTIKRMYDTGTIPADFTKCIIIPIPKKAKAQTCDQYRTLSLTSHASKILTRIILRRIEKNIDNFLTDDQFGFRRGMGTREAIITLRQIIEKRNKKGKVTYLSFVDLEKAFDNVNWSKMFELLKKIGINFKDRQIIHSLYKNEVGVIRSGEVQEEAVIQKGVRQGCSLSPYLFNVYVQEAINHIKEDTNVGIKIHGEKIDMLRFADDIAIITENENDLQRILERMNTIMKTKYNMRMNRTKTKVLVCSRNTEEQRPRPILIENEYIEIVKEYKYLGSLITSDGTSKKEIKSRIMQAKNAFNKKKNLLTSRGIDLNTRKRLIKTFVWSVLLYGSEAWTMGKGEERRLMAFEAWCWRRMMKISWREHVTNEEVFRRAGERRNLMKQLKKRRATLIGHLLRHGTLTARVIEGMIEGTNTVGRPPLDYIKQIMRDMNVTTYYDLKRKAEDRESWRTAANQPLGC
ncbi:hypothetical protein M8J77_024598 [Diaphorina citri]|nr:hypothetical protein M8J77_024598 [Diaphorina citri]